MSDAVPTPATQPRRVIKRYSNRKLYDTRDSSYVTLLQIAEMVRAGEEVQIIDNATKEDKTDVTLALIISEELKARPRGIPLATLKALIRQRGGRILNQLRETPVGKFIQKEEAAGGPVSSDSSSEEAQVTDAKDLQHRGLRATLEQWQSTIDERIHAVLPNFSAFRELEQTVKRLSERVAELERRLEQNPPRDEE